MERRLADLHTQEEKQRRVRSTRSGQQHREGLRRAERRVAGLLATKKEKERITLSSGDLLQARPEEWEGTMKKKVVVEEARGRHAHKGPCRT